MKKVYLMMMMLALAALSLTACGGDDEDENNSGGGSGATSSCFIKLSFDGKSYSEAIPEWICAKIDPVGTDRQNKKLTYTYDMIPHFKDEGFRFFFGLVHYRNKADLLSSSPGNYGCAKDILDDAFYNNLTFSSIFEIDGDEYKFVSGTHEVKSIMSMNNDVYIEGNFTSVFSLNGDTRNLSGSYRVRIPY